MSVSDSGYYDAQDRMIKYGKASYIYTKNGELLKKISGNDTTKYTYDSFGNLLKVAINDTTTIEYMIDASNNRIGKKINGRIVKRWLYSGGLTPLAEMDSTGNIITRFAPGYFIKNDTTYRIITDHLGSVRQVVNTANGAIVQQIEYNEYGNVIYDSNPDFQPFGYDGGIYDTQTKIVRFGARDYDPEIGRWIVKDPLGFGGGQSNLYEYCLNDPVNGFDLNGLQPIQLTNGNIAHIAILNELQNRLAVAGIKSEVEFPISGSGPNGGKGRADLILTEKNELYELKTVNEVNNAYPQLDRYMYNWGGSPELVPGTFLATRPDILAPVQVPGTLNDHYYITYEGPGSLSYFRMNSDFYNDQVENTLSFPCPKNNTMKRSGILAGLAGAGALAVYVITNYWWVPAVEF